VGILDFSSRPHEPPGGLPVPAALPRGDPEKGQAGAKTAFPLCGLENCRDAIFKVPNLKDPSNGTEPRIAPTAHTNFQPAHDTMVRGIHLKQLKSTDLQAIGIPSDGRSGIADGENEPPPNLLAEADPVLAQALEEVRQGLEATRSLLNEALQKVMTLDS